MILTEKQYNQYLYDKWRNALKATFHVEDSKKLEWMIKTCIAYNEKTYNEYLNEQIKLELHIS